MEQCSCRQGSRDIYRMTQPAGLSQGTSLPAGLGQYWILPKSIRQPSAQSSNMLQVVIDFMSRFNAWPAWSYWLRTVPALPGDSCALNNTAAQQADGAVAPRFKWQSNQSLQPFPAQDNQTVQLGPSAQWGTRPGFPVGCSGLILQPAGWGVVGCSASRAINTSVTSALHQHRRSALQTAAWPGPGWSGPTQPVLVVGRYPLEIWKWQLLCNAVDCRQSIPLVRLLRCSALSKQRDYWSGRLLQPAQPVLHQTLGRPVTAGWTYFFKGYCVE